LLGKLCGGIISISDQVSILYMPNVFFLFQMQRRENNIQSFEKLRMVSNNLFFFFIEPFMAVFYPFTSYWI
jgi:hypothetical protein